MRHLKAGSKLGRQPAHRRATLRNLVTNLIEKERIQTTLRRAKATRPLAERMITLGKRGDLHARRQAASYLLAAAAVKKLFEDVAKRFEARTGGYTRIVPVGWRKGDGADTAVLELIGTEVLQKRAEERARRSERKRKAVEEAQAEQAKAAPPDEDESDNKK